MLTLLVLASVLPRAALAILPEDGTGELPLPERIRRFHPERQGLHRGGEGWQEFLAGAGAGWQARFDERTGLPFRAWGPGIPLGPLSGEVAVEEALRALFAEHPALVGVDPRALVLDQAGYVGRTDTWYVTFQQVHEGAPVLGATVEARIRHGNLVMLGMETRPDLATLPEVLISSADAPARMRAAGPARGVPHEVREVRRVVIPLEEAGRTLFRPGWEIRSETWAPRGIWVTWVDGATGDVLGWRDEVRRLDGVVQGVYDARHPEGASATDPMPFAPVSSGSTATYTDADGAFTLAGESFTTSLAGDYVRAVNRAGAEGSLAFSGSVGTWTTAAATQAEIDTYIYVHQVRDWGLRFAPELDYLRSRITSYVNDTSIVCNAYFDGNLNFGQAGSGCNNTGRIADVAYHEWGHGFHYYSIEAGVFDSSSSEGISDMVSVFMTGDPVIAPYFWSGYAGGIRDLAPDRVYPEDWVGESHTDGLILGGAVYDLLLLLQDDLGDEAGWEVASQIFADAVKAGFTIPEAFEDFMVADDDDGDLGNGTPHLCALVEAFSLHGLGPSGSAGMVSLEHLPLDNQPAGGDHALDAGLVVFAEDCADFTLRAAEVAWSLDGGASWETAALDVAGDAISGAIPALPSGSTVHYYLQATSSEGDLVTVPSGGTINPFSFFVGELETLYFEDFEADDGGYTHELLEGEDELGADDWQHGTPLGEGGDPDFAWSGSNVWGNDLGAEQWNGEYQNERWNRLQSAPIEVAPYNDLVVQFRRWLNVEDGYYDQANLLVDGDLAWTNHATDRNIGDEHHQDDQWSLATAHVDDADLDGVVTLSWEIVSDAGLTMGGWNLDDVAVYAPDTPRNLLTVLDLALSQGESGPQLRWTHPDYDALSEVVVVWREDRFPASVEDGTVLARVQAPAPGAAGALLAASGQAREEVFYAVFATDDDGNWNRGAYEGFNALRGPMVVGDPNAGNGDGDLLAASPHCGCGTRPAPGGLPFLAAVGLLAGARRRRRR